MWIRARLPGRWPSLAPTKNNLPEEVHSDPEMQIERVISGIHVAGWIEIEIIQMMLYIQSVCTFHLINGLCQHTHICSTSTTIF